jgi:carbohydrate diacid regulator
LAILTDSFERIAAEVTIRTAEVLAARVHVVDERGVVVASSEPDAIGLSERLLARESDSDLLRVPFDVGTQAGTVILAASGGEVISPRLARVLIEMMVNQATIFARLPDQHALKNEFIHTLLRGSIGNEADVIREGQILGMDLTLPRAVILIDASEYVLSPEASNLPEVSEAQIRRRAQLVIASIVNFFHLPSDTICAYIGKGEIAVLKASTTQDLVAWTDGDDATDQWGPSWANLSALKRAGTALLSRLRHDTACPISIGIGRYHPGIRGLARSYQDALAALSLGQRFHGTNQVHCLDGLGSAAFVGVSDERTKIDLATHLLSPLDHEPELLETLDTFFDENLCSTTTAARLSIHRNTLSYRLDKITALVGLDPRRFDDAVQIHLALLLRAFQIARA